MSVRSTPAARLTPALVAGERHRRGLPRQPLPRYSRVPRATRLAGALPQHRPRAPARARLARAHAWIPPRRHVTTRSTDPPEGMLQRLREAHRRTGAGMDLQCTCARSLAASLNPTCGEKWHPENFYICFLSFVSKDAAKAELDFGISASEVDQPNFLSAGDHGPGPHLAPGALHVRSLQPGAGHEELLRAWRQALLRAWLPQSVLAAMRLLQRAHPRRQFPEFILIAHVLTDVWIHLPSPKFSKKVCDFELRKCLQTWVLGLTKLRLPFVQQKCVTALEKTWHTEHFFCAQCGQQFGEDGFHERDGKPYCRNDYFDMFAPKCGGCNKPIMENYISALNTQWHPDCFVCRVSIRYLNCRFPLASCYLSGGWMVSSVKGLGFAPFICQVKYWISLRAKNYDKLFL